MNIGIADLGKVVECPKCGKTGRVGLEYSRAKGNRYVYLAVRHFEKGKARRCLIRRLSDAELRLVKKPESFVSESDITKLRAQLEQLQRENEQLRAQLAALKPVEEWLMYAKGNMRVVGRDEAEAIQKFYAKHKGYTEEQKALAKSIVEPLIERGLSGELSTVIYLPPPNIMV